VLCLLASMLLAMHRYYAKREDGGVCDGMMERFVRNKAEGMESNAAAMKVGHGTWLAAAGYTWLVVDGAGRLLGMWRIDCSSTRTSPRCMIVSFSTPPTVPIS
jgi:hypothetical protein